MPNEVEALCKIALIKNLSNNLSINKIKIFNDVTLKFDSMEDLKESVELLNKNNIEIVLNLEVEPIIKVSFEQNIGKLDYVCGILTKLLAVK